MSEHQNENEQNARIGLLEHYSSRAAQYGTLLVSSFIGIVVLVQAVPIIQDLTVYPGNPTVQSLAQSLVYGVCLGSLVFFLFRSLVRFLIWGKLSTYVIQIENIGAEEETNTMLLKRVHNACMQRLRQDNPRMASLGRRFFSFWILAIVIIFIFSLVCSM